jgi:hypothetical protein
MGKEFAPYEIALEMKGLGFDEPCFGYYVGLGDSKEDPFKLVQIQSEKGQFEWTDNVYHAPLYQQAFRWFRKKCSIQATIEPTKDQHRFELGFNYWIWNTKTEEEWFTEPINRPSGDYVFDTYEEAELECLKKLIKIVKEK